MPLKGIEDGSLTTHEWEMSVIMSLQVSFIVDDGRMETTEIMGIFPIEYQQVSTKGRPKEGICCINAQWFYSTTATAISK
jgi:hypothetical protein